MGRQLLTASSQKLRNDSGVVTSLPLTLSCFARSTTHANSRVLLGVGDLGESHFFALRQFTSTTVQFSAFDGGTTRNASGGLDVSGQWTHWAGVAVSATSRVCYRDGVAGTASTPSVNPSSLGFTSIGCSGSGSSNFYNGIVAFPAIWNVALTAGEIRQLAQGADPRTIRPQNLAAFWPLNTPGATVEYDQNPFAPRRHDLTVTGATPAIDPPIWTPKRKRFWLPAASAPASTSNLFLTF